MDKYLQRIRTALAHAALQGEAYNALRRMVEDECLVCGGGGQVLDTPCWKKRLIDCKPCLGTGKVLRDISQLRDGEFVGGFLAAMWYLLEGSPDISDEQTRWMITTIKALTWEMLTDEDAARLVAEVLEKNLTDEVKK